MECIPLPRQYTCCNAVAGVYDVQEREMGILVPGSFWCRRCGALPAMVFHYTYPASLIPSYQVPMYPTTGSRDNLKPQKLHIRDVVL